MCMVFTIAHVPTYLTYCFFVSLLCTLCHFTVVVLVQCDQDGSNGRTKAKKKYSTGTVIHIYIHL